MPDMSSDSAAETTRIRHPQSSYLFDIVRILLPYDTKGLHRSIVLARLRTSRRAHGLSVPANFESYVQKVVQRHSAQSEMFSGSPEDNLFFWPDGERTSRWAVHRKPALAWLRRKAFTWSNNRKSRRRS
jgi:hypothetical protein